VADLGVLVPIAVTLIVVNGMSPTAALLPAGLAYLLVARVYGLPVAVQPLKAFGAAAIAAGAGVDVIAAGALLMGVAFLALSSGNLLGRVAGWFPKPVIRGVQLAVALVFCKIAIGLVAHPPSSFTPSWSPTAVLVGTVVLAGLLLMLRERLLLPVVVLALVVAVVGTGGDLQWGPSQVAVSLPGWEAFTTAAVLLVLPQIPLTLTNSCIAPADAARHHYGPDGGRVTPSRLARTLGASNILAGAVGGMPVCHGAGGMSAHHAFGARTWRAPALMGAALVLAAVLLGSSMGAVLPHFPLAVLAALLVVAAWAHARLLRDLSGRAEWVVALGVGAAGAWFNLAVAVIAGIVVAYLLPSRAREFDRVC
jgi:MFS superfamily sulfate permease-like transporter